MTKEKKKKFNSKYLIGAFFVFLPVLTMAFVWQTQNIQRDLENYTGPIVTFSDPRLLIGGEVTTVTNQPEKDQRPEEKEIRALYLTFITAANEKSLDRFIQYTKDTNINALVIDIKNASGIVAYDSQLEIVEKLKSKKAYIKDLKAIVDKLHENDIYVIARQVVFLDNTASYTKPEWTVKNKYSGHPWTDFKGQRWLDQSNQEVWDYNLAIAKEVIEFGVDEINLDYVRFPSDGYIRQTSYANMEEEQTKQEIMTGFFKYFSEGLDDSPAYFSVDLFGLTTVRTDDMNIGQNIEAIGPYVDYICPMVYPSHYPVGYMNLSNPASNPYPIIFDAMEKSVDRLSKVENNRAKIRPWIQDFDLGAVYTPYLIQQEISAAEEGGGYGYLVWNARNVYEIGAYK